jgi:predicted phage-related endonuclease
MSELIRQAVARGWTHEKNASKEMDVDLAEAISIEVSAELQRQLAEVQHGIQDMETKLHNECQAHERTRQQLAEAQGEIELLKSANSDVARIAKERDEAQAENKRLRETLRYISFHRNVLGQTLIELLPEHKQNELQLMLKGAK